MAGKSMRMQGQDGWRRPENIYRSLLTSAVLTMGAVLVACIVVVLVCHVFETSVPEANFLRYAYAHSGMIVAVISMAFGFTAIHVTLKLNESVKIQEFHQRYSGEDALRAIRAVADVGRMWELDAVAEFGHPRFTPRSAENNPEGRIAVENIAELQVDGARRRPWSEEQDKARRALGAFYRSAYRLYANRSIGKAALLEICATDAIVLLFNVIEPMEAMINDDYNWHEFHGLMKALKNVYPSFSKRTRSHLARPVYWNGVTGTWQDQVAARCVKGDGFDEKDLQGVR